MFGEGFSEEGLTVLRVAVDKSGRESVGRSRIFCLLSSHKKGLYAPRQGIFLFSEGRVAWFLHHGNRTVAWVAYRMPTYALV